MHASGPQRWFGRRGCVWRYHRASRSFGLKFSISPDEELAAYRRGRAVYTAMSCRSGEQICRHTDSEYGDLVMRTLPTILIAGLLSTSALAAPRPMTQDSGAPVADNENSKTAGPDGPVLLEDFHLIEKLARFDRERIPERVVHARGTGAQGVFVASTDLSRDTKASLFAHPGKETPVFVRLSTVMGFRGSPEAARDPRGFAVKFYTDQGNWDLVGINWPVFFIRDAIKFPDFVHANKPSAVTDVQDPNLAFDFFSRTPESTHMLTLLYSDQGMPASYRNMDGFGVHAFRLVNAQGQQIFAKFHWKSLQGLQGMTLEQQHAADPNYATKDLYDNIRAGHFPQWDLYVQLLTAEQVAQLPYDGFDDTKTWENVPETKVGTMTLNKIPDNYFQYTEQSAFAPGVMVPGIEPSPDKMLQGRLFSYADTQRYRIGANYQELPVNRPLVAVANNNQDGAMSFVPQVGEVNYEPSNARDAGAVALQPQFALGQYPVSGVTQQTAVRKTDDFSQAGDEWRSYDKKNQADLIKDLASDLNQVHDHDVKLRQVSYFYKADPDYGTQLAQATHLDVAEVSALAAKEVSH
ncbi:MAG: catalase [Acetobacteraceae bacterium]|nr:catalase [Acetobacteraceae bacterium]